MSEEQPENLTVSGMASTLIPTGRSGAFVATVMDIAQWSDRIHP